MSLLASIGLIVSSPIIGEVVVIPDGETISPLMACEEAKDAILKHGDSSVVQGAEDSVIENFAPQECVESRTIYETNLVHRLPSEGQIYKVKISVPAPDNSTGENE